MRNEITYPPKGSLGLDNWFYPTLYKKCNYIPMLGLRSNHDNKGWVHHSSHRSKLWFLGAIATLWYWCRITISHELLLMYAPPKCLLAHRKHVFITHKVKCYSVMGIDGAFGVIQPICWETCYFVWMEWMVHTNKKIPMENAYKHWFYIITRVLPTH